LKIKEVLHQYGLENEPVGVDVVEMPILSAFAKEGITLVDGQQVFLEARRIKTKDEISLLTHAASMVDAAYEELYSFLRPGVKENECVGLVNKTLYDLGSEHVEGVNAISGAARRTPTSTVTVSFARVIRRSSTSCTATTVIARAITGPSRSAAPRSLNATPTPSVASW